MLMGCFESVNNDTINEDTFGLIPAGKQKRLCAKTESPSGGSAKCVISFLWTRYSRVINSDSNGDADMGMRALATRSKKRDARSIRGMALST
eukprot:XP_001706879.1 Hypothetical protein GL50803_93911 [Giardia lamblia ATCC 50803]